MDVGTIFAITILVLSTCGVVFICIMAFIVEPIIYKCKERKIQKYHPEWNIKLEELNTLASESCRVYNREIAPLKRTIDHAIKYELPYLTEELTERKNIELEAYRKHIAMYQQICDGLDEKAQEIREWLKAYNKEHHISKCWNEE